MGRQKLVYFQTVVLTHTEGVDGGMCDILGLGQGGANERTRVYEPSTVFKREVMAPEHSAGFLQALPPLNGSESPFGPAVKCLLGVDKSCV